MGWPLWLNEENSITRQTFLAKPMGTCPRCRPKLRWIDYQKRFGYLEGKKLEDCCQQKIGLGGTTSGDHYPLRVVEPLKKKRERNCIPNAIQRVSCQREREDKHHVCFTSNSLIPVFVHL